MKRLFSTAVFLIFAISPVFSQDMIDVTNYAKNFSDWKVKAFRGKAKFEVKQAPRPMVTLTTAGTSFMLAKQFRKLKMAEHPYLNVEWMVNKLPDGADLRSRSTDDQAAGVYVTLPSFPEFINFKSIGYVWETSAPPGNYDSKVTGNIKFIVLKSGDKDGMGQWHSEKRNYVEDFKKLWGENPKNRKVVVSLAADSDNTRSSSTASFGKIFFSNN